MIFIKKKTWTDEKEKSRMIFTSQHPVPLELPYLEKKRASLARRGTCFVCSSVYLILLFFFSDPKLVVEK